MAMEESDLMRILEQAIVQPRYEGVGCPNERALSDFVAGDSPDEREAVARHLAACLPCRELSQALAAAGQEFAQRSATLWSTVAARMAAAGFARGSPLVIRFAEWRRSAEAAWDEAVRRLVAGLAGAAASALAPPLAAAPGYRSQGGSAVVAPLLAADATPRTDDAGRPRAVRFDVLRAELEPDGHLVIDVSTAQREYWETPGRRFAVEASLHHADVRLVLPRQPVYEDGRATIVAQLPPGTAVPSLPLSAVALAVYEP